MLLVKSSKMRGLATVVGALSPSMITISTGSRRKLPATPDSEERSISPRRLSPSPLTSMKPPSPLPLPEAAKSDSAWTSLKPWMVWLPSMRERTYISPPEALPSLAEAVVVEPLARRVRSLESSQILPPLAPPTPSVSTVPAWTRVPEEFLSTTEPSAFLINWSALRLGATPRVSSSACETSP